MGRVNPTDSLAPDGHCAIMHSDFCMHGPRSRVLRENLGHEIPCSFDPLLIGLWVVVNII